MPSHAAKAKQATDRDKSRLTLVSAVDGPGKTLHAPDPGKTAGDAARQAARDALPPHQQAKYDELVAAGTRHVTALGAARKHPEPAPEPECGELDPVAKAAADLFAAFNAAGTQGAAGPAETLTKLTETPPGPEPVPAPKPVPVPQPKATEPPKPAKPKTPKASPPPPAAPADGSCNRHIGTVTATDLSGAEH